jgi:glutamate formiminotransferase
VQADVFESVPNFSEGRDQGVIAAIASATSPAHLLDLDPDPDHNRVVVSLAASGSGLVGALVAAVAAAVERIDLTQHRGVHPRVGAADVVPIVPLGGTSLEACSRLARTLGQRIWDELHVPVFFYGYGQRWTLADVRGGRARPDLGGPELHPTAGAVCVGARPLLVAFNVILRGMTLDEARALARSLRESSGGMRGVQALVFELPKGRLQLSMNLFRPAETPPAAVIAELERRGVAFQERQLVGLCPAVAADAASAGRVLEARLAAAAAREAARRCRDRGGDEHQALAGRLEREAADLTGLGVDQQVLLAGAERAAALAPVMRAAGVLDAELQAMTVIAARGLSAALTPATRAAYEMRAGALDRRLGNRDGS